MKKFIAISLLIFLTSCSSNKKQLAQEESFNDNQLYEMATRNYDAGAYNEANKYFKRLNQEYPYSTHASNSQFMEGMAHFRLAEFDDAIEAFNEFISLYPTNENIDYVYYMRAIAYYDQITEVKLDQSITEQAGEALQEVINRFPDSKYAKDAAYKLNLVEDHLAGKEMYIGRFYLKRNEIIGAIGRFQNVVDKYQETSHIKEALYRLVASYYTLGIIDEAKRNAAVLGKNYPDSKWYKHSFDLLNAS